MTITSTQHKTIYAYIAAVTLGLVFMVLLAGRASALDAQFVPQASVTLACQDADSSAKKITKFENNAPTGSNVSLFEQGANGAFGSKDLVVGDVVVNTPRLFWSINGVNLGPWEVPASVEGTCLTNERGANDDAATAKTGILPYLTGAAIAVAAIGVFVLIQARAKK